MKWLWLLHREWTRRAEEAQEEVDRSEKNLRRTREQAVTLAQWREQNHFARLIHDSLSNGRESL